MRRLAVIMWHMLTKWEQYHYGGSAQRSRTQDDPRMACQEVDRRAVLLGMKRPTKSGNDQASTGSSSPVAGVERSHDKEAPSCQA
jgi:hypothetical protein